MALVFPNVGEGIALKALVNHTPPQNLSLRLFSNNITPAETDTAATFTEATGGGYAPKALAGASWVVTEGRAIRCCLRAPVVDLLRCDRERIRLLLHAGHERPFGRKRAIPRWPVQRRQRKRRNSRNAANHGGLMEFRKGQWVLVDGSLIGIHVVGDKATQAGEVHLVNEAGETTSILPAVHYTRLVAAPREAIPAARLQPREGLVLSQPAAHTAFVPAGAGVVVTNPTKPGGWLRQQIARFRA